MWQSDDNSGETLSTDLHAIARPRPQNPQAANQLNNDLPIPRLAAPPVVSNPAQFPSPSSQPPPSYAVTAAATSNHVDSQYLQTSTTLAQQYYPEPQVMTFDAQPHRTVTTRSGRTVNVIDGGVVTPAGWPGYLAAAPAPSNRLVKQRDLPIYLGLSILAAILFFPTGLIALYHAVRLRKAFQGGIYANDLQHATKIAKNCEKCLLLTLVMAFVAGFLIFGLVDYYTLRPERPGSNKSRSSSTTMSPFSG